MFRRRASALVVVAVIGLSAAACNNTTQQASPKAALAVGSTTSTTATHSERVASFSGSGNSQTAPFTIDPAAISWQISWSMAGHANVVTLKTADGQTVSQVLNHVGATLSHVKRAGGGTYSLSIETDAAWSTFIDQTLPGAAPEPVASTVAPTTLYVPPTTVYVPPATVYVPPATAAPAPSCPNGSYINSNGNRVCSPYANQSGPPAGATAQCKDGTYSFSQHHQGTCSGHGGVAQFYN